MATVKPLSVPTKRLQASITVSASAFQVSDILGWNGSALTSADFGTLAYCVLRDANSTVVEFMEIDPATIASTSITINKRGLNYSGDYTTELASRKLSWVKGSLVEFGASIPQLLQHYVTDIGDQTIAGIKTFTSSPIVPEPTTATQVASKNYVDTTAVSGAPNASTTVKGIVEEATQAEVRARTVTGGTAADLYVNPGTMPNVLISDYVADTGAVNAAVITPVPAITAYVTGQRFSFKVVDTNTTTTPTVNVNGLGAKTIVKTGAVAIAVGDILINQIVEVEYDGTNMQLMSPVGNAPLTQTAYTSIVKFGGTGADGALSVTSGTTTIDCANAAVVIKNYTTISISVGATLAFSNPATTGTTIILKATGNVTIAGTIDASTMGAEGGAGGGIATDGSIGTTALGILDDTTTHYGFGGDYIAGNPSVGGAGGAIYANKFLYTNTVQRLARLGFNICPGSGGGGGGGPGADTNTSVGVAGGRGGGALIIQCGGAWNFTGTINTSGSNGTTASAAGTTNGNSKGGGGGGGGAAGFFLGIYNTLTASSGTVTASGGTGGAGGNVSKGAAGGDTNPAGPGGGGAGCYGTAGGAGGAGAVGGSANGTGGSAAAAGGGAGGGGGGGAYRVNTDGAQTGGAGGAGGDGTGMYLIAQNNYFA